jgi:hypothetical protein
MIDKKQIKFNARTAIKSAIRYPDRARLAAQAIVSDLCDRGGIKHAWNDIDKEIQQEIVDTWHEIISTVFDYDLEIDELIKPATEIKNDIEQEG